MGLWESGGGFLRKFPFYEDYLLKNSHLIIYTLSLTSNLTDDSPLLDKLNQLISLTRETWKAIPSSSGNSNRPKELVLLTKAD